MEFIRGLHNLKPHHKGCVLTIGVFDGVHIGHRTLLERLAVLGEDFNLPSTLMMFEPQPQEVLHYMVTSARLTPLRDKVEALERTSVDRVLCLRFNSAFAKVTAADFIDRILVHGLGARHIVVGDDFRFGYQAEGDFEVLREAGTRHGFEVHRRDTYRVAGDRVSSTRIRNALALGQMEAAAEMLGRWYTVSGKVRIGRQLGRTIGFPTANIALRHKVCPISGVFAVRVRFENEERLYPGVANVGVRPTVDGATRLLEVNLFDFDADIYGRHVTVEFVHRIREERKFESLDALKTQIGKDANSARAFLAGLDNG